jgi:hypothetical protein
MGLGAVATNRSTKLALGNLLDPDIRRVLWGLRPGAVAALNTGAEIIIIHSERRSPAIQSDGTAHNFKSSSSSMNHQRLTTKGKLPGLLVESRASTKHPATTLSPGAWKLSS